VHTITKRHLILVPSTYLTFKISTNKKHYSSQWEGEQFSLDGKENNSRYCMEREQFSRCYGKKTILIVVARRTIILVVLESRTT
jgi:hypothetical protein